MSVQATCFAFSMIMTALLQLFPHFAVLFSQRMSQGARHSQLEGIKRSPLKTQAINDYNDDMGGLDLFDQDRAAYHVLQKTRECYM